LAVSVLAAERALSDLDGAPSDRQSDSSRRALEQVPHAATWAREFTDEMRASARGFHRHAAPNTVRYAVVGIAQACIPDPDVVLRDLLAAAIDDCTRILRPEAEGQPAVSGDAWVAACELTGVTAR
jgi:hypothetical protein